MNEKELLEQIKKLQEENECLRKQVEYEASGSRNMLNKCRKLKEENEGRREAIVRLTLERLGV